MLFLQGVIRLKGTLILLNLYKVQILDKVVIRFQTKNSTIYMGILILHFKDLISLHILFRASRLYEPVHEISNIVVCATSEALDQPAHTRSLIRAFASRLSIL